MPTEGFAAGEEDFGKFFDNLGELAAEKKPIPANFGAPDVAVVAPAPAPAAVAAPAVVDPGVVAEPAAAAVESAVATPAVAGDPPAVPAAVVPAADAPPVWLEQFVAAVRQPAPAPAARAAPQPAPLYSQEEVALLQQFEKDWPDFAKVLPVLFRGQNAHQRAEMMQTITSTYVPVQQTLQTVADQQQYGSLRSAIPDYDAVRDPVVKWALNDPSIPGYLRAAYKGVIDAGEVSDIVDLVGTWRKATGTAAPSGGGAPVLAVKDNQLSEAAKQAAKALAPVVSGRTQVVQSSTPEDFDGAFEHFSKPVK